MKTKPGTYTIRVRQWVMFEDTVQVVASCDRDARELARREARLDRGTISKNRTSIVARPGGES